MLTPAEHAPLAPHCTLRIGGPARYLVEATDEATVAEAVRWAASRALPVRVLGGGSNLVIADEGVDGLVLRIALRGLTTREIPGAVEVTAAAGEPWDEFVRHTVERGWAGLECLSGIPGLVGATPIQNVGAYGQEVSDTLTAVRALDRESGRVVTLAPADCGFGYRDSLFKSRAPGRYVVLAATYRLVPGLEEEAGGAADPERAVGRERRVLDRGDHGCVHLTAGALSPSPCPGLHPRPRRGRGQGEKLKREGLSGRAASRGRPRPGPRAPAARGPRPPRGR